MKKCFTFLLFLGTSLMLHAQSAKQVHWIYTTKKISDKVYEVHLTASINDGYHLYAQDAGGDGPVPTSFSFTKSPLISYDGKTKEQGKIIKKFESAWNHDLYYYEQTVDFIQRVQLKAKVKTNVTGKVEFMVCNEKQCLPPSTVDFSVNVGG